MALQNIPAVGDDAFTQGFLNKKFADKVLSRVNRINKDTIILPPGLGTAKVTDSEDSRIFDFTLMKVPGQINFDVWVSGTLNTYAFNAVLVPPPA